MPVDHDLNLIKTAIFLTRKADERCSPAMHDLVAPRICDRQHRRRISVFRCPATTTAGASEPQVSATCDGTVPSGSVIGMAETSDGGGYWIATNYGAVVACGDAPFLGSADTNHNFPGCRWGSPQKNHPTIVGTTSWRLTAVSSPMVTPVLRLNGRHPAQQARGRDGRRSEDRWLLAGGI